MNPNNSPVQSATDVVLPTPDDLHRLREEAGASRTELAAVADVDVRTVERLETGEADPQLSTLSKVLAALMKIEERGVDDVVAGLVA